MNDFENKVRGEEPPLNKEAIIAEIKFIRQEVAKMGANDSELPDLNNLIKQVERDEIRPQEALARAIAIKDLKNSYH